MNSISHSALSWRIVVALAITFFSNVVLLAQCALDTVPPVVQLKANPIIYIDIMSPDYPNVHVKDFEMGSSDNCTPHDSLVFRIEFLSQNFFEACTQIFPATSLPPFDSCKVEELCFAGYRIWAIDKAGNKAYKDWFLKESGPFWGLQTKIPVCANADPGYVITGKVLNSKGFKIPDVEINTTLTLDNSPNIFHYKKKTNEQGTYFTGQEFSYGKICHASVKARKITKQKSDYTQGISTYDLLLLHQHVLNIAPFTLPYQRIAGDINNSGTLSTIDVVWLRKLILGIIDSFPNNKTWRFIPETFVFPDPNNPWKTAFPDSIVVENTFVGVANFTGIKIGDLNFSAVAEVQTPSTPSIFPLELEDRHFQTHERVEVPIFAGTNSDLFGYQGTLEYDQNALELVEIVGEKDNFALHKGGKITFSEMRQPKQGEELFRLIFRSKQQGTIWNSLKLSNAITKSEGYRKGGEMLILDLRTLEQF